MFNLNNCNSAAEKLHFELNRIEKKKQSLSLALCPMNHECVRIYFFPVWLMRSFADKNKCHISNLCTKDIVIHYHLNYMYAGDSYVGNIEISLLCCSLIGFTLIYYYSFVWLEKLSKNNSENINTTFKAINSSIVVFSVVSEIFMFFFFFS